MQGDVFPWRRHRIAPSNAASRPGSTLLGNGELAERTGLSPATVSRLTQTLVGAGLLEHDRPARAYRLAAPVLSLAHAMRTGSVVLQVAAPRMRALAEKLRINVGLAVADRSEMLYLESIRYNRKASLRSVVSGQRVPIELTSLGRAWLAVAPEARRTELLREFEARRSDWPQLRKDIDEAIDSVPSRLVHGVVAARDRCAGHAAAAGERGGARAERAAAGIGRTDRCGSPGCAVCPMRPPPRHRAEGWGQLSVRRKSRTSVMMACGSSQAAKCPPLA